MFWSDPNLYGVTLPYKDLANPLATGLHHIPRFLPPTYGFSSPFFPPQVNPQGLLPTQPLAQQPFTPFAQQPITPFAQQPFTPFMQQLFTPFMQQPFTPMVQPFGQFLRPELMPSMLGVNPYTQAYNFTPQPIVPFRPFF